MGIVGAMDKSTLLPMAARPATTPHGKGWQNPYLLLCLCGTYAVCMVISTENRVAWACHTRIWPTLGDLAVKVPPHLNRRHHGGAPAQRRLEEALRACVQGVRVGCGAAQHPSPLPLAHFSPC